MHFNKFFPGVLLQDPRYKGTGIEGRKGGAGAGKEQEIEGEGKAAGGRGG
jgi:hypothetical protein